MVGVEKIRSLNERIEKINKERTKAEAQLEMRKKQLEESLSAYEKKYGVKLKGAEFADTANNVKAELKKVSDAVKAEYDLKEKVVACIENGEFDEAYELLGIENPNVSVADASVVSDDDVVDVDMDFGVDEDTEVVDPDLNADDDDAEMVSDDEEYEKVDAAVFRNAVKQKKEVKGTSAVDAVADMEMDMEMEEDDIPSLDDDDFGFGDILKGTEFEVDEN